MKLKPREIPLRIRLNRLAFDLHVLSPNEIRLDGTGLANSFELKLRRRNKTWSLSGTACVFGVGPVVQPFLVNVECDFQAWANAHPNFFKFMQKSAQSSLNPSLKTKSKTKK